MKILLINKFLYPRGGSETYVFRLGAALEEAGHQVQYFGMEDPKNILGNRAGSFAPAVDFHHGSPLRKWAYPVKTIYSPAARRSIRQVLEDFRPDVCHLNNFHYQLTPSILLEIKDWSKRSGHPCKMLYTAHDFQLVCPNHLCRNREKSELCQDCLKGHYTRCVKGRCIHGSCLKSMVGALENWLWNRSGIYESIDAIICCSHFLKKRLDTNPILAKKTRVIPNFTEDLPRPNVQKQPYVLYFGRYDEEKGIRLLLEAAKALPEISFRFAGIGPLGREIETVSNAQNLGFQTGDDLRKLIAQARFTVCPSIWYENCPMSILESIQLGTPVLGAGIGGIPELIQPGKNGILFEAGNREALIEAIRALWNHPISVTESKILTAEGYLTALLPLYTGEEKP